jgi:hypothetical protein
MRCAYSWVLNLVVALWGVRLPGGDGVTCNDIAFQKW